MIDYLLKYPNKLFGALLEHVEIVGVTLLISLIAAALLTLVAVFNKKLGSILVNLFSAIYSIPSLALFALMIPLTGLGFTTTVLVLTAYNQYLLVRNFVTGLNEVDPAIVEAACGMGMTGVQVLLLVQLPLSKRALFAGVRLAIISTIGIATIAATINAGGLGTILLDGLRTMNVYKIVWGSLLSAGLAIGMNALLGAVEKRLA